VDVATVFQRLLGAGPCAPVVVVDGGEGVGVVEIGDVHAAEVRAPPRCSASAAAMSARAEASSSGVEGPVPSHPFPDHRATGPQSRFGLGGAGDESGQRDPLLLRGDGQRFDQGFIEGDRDLLVCQTRSIS